MLTNFLCFYCHSSHSTSLSASEKDPGYPCRCAIEDMHSSLPTSKKRLTAIFPATAKLRRRPFPRLLHNTFVLAGLDVEVTLRIVQYSGVEPSSAQVV